VLLRQAHARSARGASCCDAACVGAVSGEARTRSASRVWFPDTLDRASIRKLGIQIAHILAIADLPYHHRDPFDRLLIARRQVEKLPFVTTDSKIALYDIECIR